MARRIFFLSLVCALALGSSSCVEADASLILNGNLPAVGEVDEDGNFMTCNPQANDMIFFLEGAVDVAELKGVGGQSPLQTVGRFQIGISLVNRLTGNGETGQGLRLNSNIVQLRQVTINFPQLDITRTRQVGTLIESDNSRVATFIDVIQNLDELAEIEAALIANGVMDDSSIATVRAEIQASGQTVGETDVVSNILVYPISFCLSCEDLTTTPICVEGM